MGGGLSKVGQNVKATISDLNVARKKRPPLGSYERHRLVRMSATAATLPRALTRIILRRARQPEIYARRDTIKT